MQLDKCVNCPYAYMCCNECFDNNAYFQEIDEEYYAYLKERFGWTKKGFLGDDGCKLPRELRSRICLSYSCQ